MATSETSSAPIVVAYDGSESAHAAIEAVASLAPGAAVTVISVWQPVAEAARVGVLAVPSSVALSASREIDEAAAREAAKLADEGAAHLRGLGRDATGLAVEGQGNIWSAVVDYAENERAALVAVGSRGLSSVKSALLGSVSNAVVHHCTRPVLVVRPSPGG
jgi:nucleotide-binding universal stress UspA family protein